MQKGGIIVAIFSTQKDKAFRCWLQKVPPQLQSIQPMNPRFQCISFTSSTTHLLGVAIFDNNLENSICQLWGRQPFWMSLCMHLHVYERCFLPRRSHKRSLLPSHHYHTSQSSFWCYSFLCSRPPCNLPTQHLSPPQPPQCPCPSLIHSSWIGCHSK